MMSCGSLVPDSTASKVPEACRCLVVPIRSDADAVLWLAAFWACR